MSTDFKKLALLFLIPFALVACGGGEEEEESSDSAASSEPKAAAPKKKKRKKGEPVLVTTGKTHFVNICMDVTDATFGKGDPNIKLFTKSACEGELLQAFYEHQTLRENRNNTISFNADHVLYRLYNTPKYWSKEKTNQVRKEREAKAKEQAERIKQRKEELQKRQAEQEAKQAEQTAQAS